MYFSVRVYILPDNTVYVVIYQICALIVYLVVNLYILDVLGIKQSWNSIINYKAIDFIICNKGKQNARKVKILEK